MCLCYYLNTNRMLGLLRWQVNHYDGAYSPVYQGRWAKNSRMREKMIEETIVSEVPVEASTNAQPATPESPQTLETPQSELDKLSTESHVDTSKVVPEETTQEEPLVPQSKVDKLVGYANVKRKEAEQKLAVYQQQYGELEARRNALEDKNSTEAIKLGAAAEIVKMQYQEHAVNEYKQAVSAYEQNEAVVRSKIPDFDRVVSATKGDYETLFNANPAIPLILTTVDNPAHVAYELSRDPAKFATFSALAMSKSNGALQNFVAQVSESVKGATKRSNVVAPAKPIPTISPSPKASGGAPNVIVNGATKIDPQDYRF